MQRRKETNKKNYFVTENPESTEGKMVNGV